MPGSCDNLIKQFKSHQKKKPLGQLIISASYSGTIVGLNRYENAREIIAKHTKDYKVESKNTKLKPDDPRAIGIKYETPAVKHYCNRHRLYFRNGFKPPYVFAEKDGLFLGGEGDFIYKSKQNTNILLEIKCLTSRKITRKIPFHYWLQVQTMLYVYHLLNIDIDHGIYCENVFSQDGSLKEYWECRVDLDLEYYEEKILPIFINYNNIYVTKNDDTPRKIQREVISPPEDFFRKTRKPNLPLIHKVHPQKIYSHFMTHHSVFGPSCLYNFIKNNNLRDWYYHREICKGDINKTPMSKGEKTYDSLDISKILPLLNPILKSDTDFDVINIEKESLPDHPNICDKPYHEHFSPIKYNETLNAMREGIDIIFGGQLYNPEKGFWVNYDILIKNSALIDKINVSFCKEDIDYTRPYPKHYTPLKIISFKYNTDNLTSKKARIELMLQLDALNFYYSKPNNNFLVLDSEEKITEIDIRKLPNLTKRFEKGFEWLTDLTEGTLDLKADPPNDTRMFPNSKVFTRDTRYEEFKTNLINKHKELTSIWSISNQKRDKLVQSKYNIRSVDDLEKHIDKEEVVEILGNAHPNIKNMLRSNKSGKIINLRYLREELKELKNNYEIFLDFEFTHEFIYMIGIYQVKPKDTPLQRVIKSVLSKYGEDMVNKMFKRNGPIEKSFRQMVLKDNTEDSQADLLNEFANYIKNLFNESKEPITCYHWGQVEEKLIKKYLPDIFDLINFIDLHELVLDHHLAIPNCKSYTIKDVAKTLREMGHIKTSWEENTDGYWCNQALNTLLTKHASPEDTTIPVPLKDCDGIDKIMDYNHTDCEVLHDLVKYFRGDN